jgi:hypothetical protein
MLGACESGIAVTVAAGVVHTRKDGRATLSR